MREASSGWRCGGRHLDRLRLRQPSRDEPRGIDADSITRQRVARDPDSVAFSIPSSLIVREPFANTQRRHPVADLRGDSHGSV
jgi:hypothetical protein